MKKTNKAALAQHLESIVDPADVPGRRATLIDAMALTQKLHGENRTFEELSDYIFESSLHAGQGSDRIDVIFAVYMDQSIKSAECVSRGSQEGVTFKKIRPGHKIKKKLETCSEKNKLTKFLAESLKEESKREKMGS